MASCRTWPAHEVAKDANINNAVGVDLDGDSDQDNDELAASGHNDKPAYSKLVFLPMTTSTDFRKWLSFASARSPCTTCDSKP
jgi:hypothetical protein